MSANIRKLKGRKVSITGALALIWYKGTFKPVAGAMGYVGAVMGGLAYLAESPGCTCHTATACAKVKELRIVA